MFFLFCALIPWMPSTAELPKLEKAWRIEPGGSSIHLHYSKAGQLLVQSRMIEWKGKEFVREYDRIQAICPESKVTPKAAFPDKLRGLAYTPDGKRCVIVKGYRGHDLELWDLVEQKPLKSTGFGIFKASFSMLCLNQQGTEFLVVNNGSVERWDVASLTKLEELAAPSGQLWLSHIAFTPEGQPLGVYARNLNYENKPGDILVWHYPTQKFIRRIPLSISPRYISLTENCRYVVAGSTEGTIRLWELDCTETEPTITLSGHTREHYRLIVHPTESLIATSSLDNSVILWDIKSQKSIARNTFPRNGLSMNLAFSPHSRHLYVSGNVLRDSPDSKQVWTGFITQFKLPGN